MANNITTGPSFEYEVATPSGTPLARAARAIYVATTGDVTVTGDNGVQTTFANMVGGVTYPISCRILHAAPAGTILLY